MIKSIFSCHFLSYLKTTAPSLIPLSFPFKSCRQAAIIPHRSCDFRHHPRHSPVAADVLFPSRFFLLVPHVVAHPLMSVFKFFCSCGVSPKILAAVTPTVTSTRRSGKWMTTPSSPYSTSSSFARRPVLPVVRRAPERLPRLRPSRITTARHFRRNLGEPLFTLLIFCDALIDD